MTGESTLRCAVRIVTVNANSHAKLTGMRMQRSIMGQAFSQVAPTWTYRYNQRNPTWNTTLVGHASENWMFFQGTNTA